MDGLAIERYVLVLGLWAESDNAHLDDMIGKEEINGCMSPTITVFFRSHAAAASSLFLRHTSISATPSLGKGSSIPIMCSGEFLLTL